MTRLTITGTGTLTMTGMTIRNWGSALKKREFDIIFRTKKVARH